jgi:cyanobactin maturation PatA/PatG family protease
MTSRTIPGLPELWNETTGDPDVCIIVLDGRVDLKHECFSGATIEEIEFYESAINCDEKPSTHGTAVASIIFGRHGGPVEGMAPACRGLALPIYEEPGAGKLSYCSQIDLARAITKSVEVARKFASGIVVNISGGELSQSGTAHPILTEVIQRYSSQGVVFVAAAGNHGCDCLNVPGALPSVVAVGAMNERGQPLDFSNWGRKYRTQGLLAPGENVLGATPGGGTSQASGTSFATAIVSGVAGLLFSVQRKLGQRPDAVTIREALLQSAVGCDNDRSEDDCKKYLVGRLNVSGAWNIIKGEPSKMSLEPSLQERTTPTGPAAAQAEVAFASPPARGDNNGRVAAAALVASDEATSARSSGDAATAATERSAGPLIQPSSLAPAACGCGGSGPPPQFVYPIGLLDYDFGTLARRDSLQSETDGTVKGRLLISEPINFLRHLLGFTEFKETEGKGYAAIATHAPHLYDAAAVNWVLKQDESPIYGIRPEGPFSEAAYEELASFLLGQQGLKRAGLDIYYDKNENPIDISRQDAKPQAAKAQRPIAAKDVLDSHVVERVALPGTITGKVRLLTNEVVPTIRFDMRGSATWSTAVLVDAVVGPSKSEGDLADFARRILDRLEDDTRNLGLAAEDRAKNYASTALAAIIRSLADTNKFQRYIKTENAEYDSIVVNRSQVCRQDSECHDVDIYFFDKSNFLAPRSVVSVTVDVSDVVPVRIGFERIYAKR